VAGIFFRRPPDPTEIVIVGARRTPFSDLYHDLLRAPWWIDLLCLSGLFLLLNLLFGSASSWSAGSRARVPIRSPTISSSACRRWARSATA
jgi:hypothetical protein